MTTNIETIREELNSHEEIEMPYLFDNDIHIKYITMKNNRSVFYRGGKYHRMGNEKIYLTNNGKMWSVPTVLRDKYGDIIYKSRFFIHKDSEDELERTSSELEMMHIIEKQQLIIKKLSNRIAQLKKR